MERAAGQSLGGRSGFQMFDDCKIHKRMWEAKMQKNSRNFLPGGYMLPGLTGGRPWGPFIVGRHVEAMYFVHGQA